MQYNNTCMNLLWVLNKQILLCPHCKIQVDKIMASVKKGMKYMVIISSKTNFLFDTSHNRKANPLAYLYGHKCVKMFSSQIKNNKLDYSFRTNLCRKKYMNVST